jgi:DNA-binding MarR family transcriptional regulator|nr:MAG TPA: helix-turn-helix domain protein [Caudoviricetes sp.]
MSSVIYEAQAAALRGITSTEKVVALILAARMNSKVPGWGGRPVTFPELTELAEDAEVDKRTVSRAIATLKERGIIQIIRFRKEDGKLSRNYYVWTADQSDAYKPDWMTNRDGMSQRAEERMTAEQQAAAAAERVHPASWAKRHASEIPAQEQEPVSKDDSQLPIETEEPAPKPQKKVKKTARSTTIPEDWTPSEKCLAYAREHYPSMPVGTEAENFRDYYLSTGTKRIDWDATWRTWCRKGNIIAKGAWVQPPTPGATQGAPAINPSTGKTLTKEDFWYACIDHGIDPAPYVNFWKPNMGIPGDSGWADAQAYLDRHTGRS